MLVMQIYNHTYTRVNRHKGIKSVQNCAAANRSCCL